MDPFSALSVAASVMQFVNFGADILQKAKELHNSADGALSENLALQEGIERLQGLVDVLQDPLNDAQQVSSSVVFSSISPGIMLEVSGFLYCYPVPRRTIYLWMRNGLFLLFAWRTTKIASFYCFNLSIVSVADIWIQLDTSTSRTSILHQSSPQHDPAKALQDICKGCVGVAAKLRKQLEDLRWPANH